MNARRLLSPIPLSGSASPRIVHLVLGGVALTSSLASAATQDRDPGLTPTANSGKGSGGDGTWTAAGTNWSDGTVDAALTTTNIAGFAGASGTVGLTTAVTAAGLHFETNGYVIGNGTTSGQISIVSQSNTDGISVATGVTGTSISVGSIKLGSSGSAVAIQLTNTDLVNFNNTTVYRSGSRTTRISNSAADATTTFQSYGLSDKPGPGYGTWPNTSTALDVGNLTINNLAPAATALGALSNFSSLTAVNATFTGNGSGTFTINGNNTLFNNVGVGGSLTLTFSMANGTLALGHNNALGARNAGDALTTTSLILSSGTVVAAGGARNIENKLVINGTTAIGGSNAITFANSVTNNGGNRTLNVNNTALTTLSGPVYLANDDVTARTLTIGGTGNTVISGDIANNSGAATIASGLTKTGAGTLTLNGVNNTYTGATIVSGGTLLINGSLGNSAISVGADGSLGGDGTFAGNLDFAAGADFAFSTTHTLETAGTVTFGGFGVANLLGLNSSVADGTYTLINGNVNFANVSNVGIDNAAALGDGKFAYLQQGSLQVVVIPEPSAGILGALGLIALMRRKRA